MDRLFLFPRHDRAEPAGPAARSSTDRRGAHASRHGVRVPDEYAMVGCIDIDSTSTAAVPSTSVRRPRQELGRRVAQLLLEEGVEGRVHEQPVCHPVLVVRESSTGRLSTAPGVRTA